jgi:hypothetical protein
MKPKIKIFLVILLRLLLSFFSQKNNKKFEIEIKSKSDKSTGEVNFRKAQLFFLERNSMKQLSFNQRC